MNIQERFDRLDAMIFEGRIVRHAWKSKDKEGRELACLLSSISPEAGAKGNPEACPASIMPFWFAHMVMWMNDKGSVEEWPRMIHRFASVIRKTTLFQEKDWSLFDYKVRAIGVREAMMHTKDADILSVCQTVVDLCESSANGNVHSEETKLATSAAARTFASAAHASGDLTRAPGAAWAAAWAMSNNNYSPMVVAAAVTTAVLFDPSLTKTQLLVVDRITVKILDALEEMCEKISDKTS